MTSPSGSSSSSTPPLSPYSYVQVVVLTSQPSSTTNVASAGQQAATVNKNAQKVAQNILTKKDFTKEDVAHTQGKKIRGQRTACIIGGSLAAVVAAPILVAAVGVGVVAGIVASPFLLGHKVHKDYKKKKINDKLTVTGETSEFIELKKLLDDYQKKIPWHITPQLTNFYPDHFFDAESFPVEDLSEEDLPVTATRKITDTKGEFCDKAQALVLAFNNCIKNSTKRSEDCEEKVKKCLDKVLVHVKTLAKTDSVKEGNKVLDNIQELLKECAYEVAGVEEDVFKKEFGLARGECTPSTLENQLDETHKEVSIRQSHAFSTDYLSQRDPKKYESQIKFMKSHPNTLRVSSLKEAEEMQGMAMNAHQHSLVTVEKTQVEDKSIKTRNFSVTAEDEVELEKASEEFDAVGESEQADEVGGETTEVESHTVYRSGAFAVHGRDKVRMAELKLELKELERQVKEWEGKLWDRRFWAQKSEEEYLGISPEGCKGVLKELNGKIENIKERMAGVNKAKQFGLRGLQNKLNDYEKQWKESTSLTPQEESEKAQALILKHLRKELGFNSIKELREEISMRRDFCISQALPELIASITQSANNKQSLEAAIAAGSFLHVVEGLLSHLDGKEKAMIEDMKDVLDYLSKNLSITFTEPGEETSIKVDEGDQGKPKITLKLAAPNDSLVGHTLRLTAIYFNTAVNEMQTIGQLMGIGATELQDEIVADGLKTLYAYGLTALKGKPKRIQEVALGSIRDHYSERGSRKTKDITGMKRREELVKLLGGQLSFKCKSGKDRTGVKVSEFFGTHSDQLLRGISYYLTSVNTGKKQGYAFNQFQRRFIPEELTRPPEELCSQCES